MDLNRVRDNIQGVQDQGLVGSAVTIVMLKLTKTQFDLHRYEYIDVIDDIWKDVYVIIYINL